MQTRNGWGPIVVLAVLLIASGGTPAVAGGETATFKCIRKFDKFEPMYENQAEGRLVFWSSEKCEYDSPGSPFHRAKTVSFTNGDIKNGAGTMHGITVGEKDGSSYRDTWTGACYQAPNKDGKVVTHCAGGFTFIEGAGTGRFKNLRGGGSWRTVDLPDNAYELSGTVYFEQ